MTASLGSPRVVGTLMTCMAPPVSRHTMSVKVPPISTPISKLRWLAAVVIQSRPWRRARAVPAQDKRSRRSPFVADRLGVEVAVPRRDDLHAGNAEGMHGNGRKSIVAHRSGIDRFVARKPRQKLAQQIGQGHATTAIAHG